MFLVCSFILISSLFLFITCVFVLPVLIIIVWSFHHINHLKCLPKTLPTLVNPVRWVFGSFKYLDITYKLGSCYLLALHASPTALLTTVMAMATHCTISVVLVAPRDTKSMPWGWSSFSPPLHSMGSVYKIILYSSGRFLLTGVFKPFLHYRHPKQPFQTIFFQLPLLLPMEHLKSQIVYRSVYVLYWSVLCIGKEVFCFFFPPKSSFQVLSSWGGIAAFENA